MSAQRSLLVIPEGVTLTVSTVGKENPISLKCFSKLLLRTYSVPYGNVRNGASNWTSPKLSRRRDRSLCNHLRGHRHLSDHGNVLVAQSPPAPRQWGPAEGSPCVWQPRTFGMNACMDSLCVSLPLSLERPGPAIRKCLLICKDTGNSPLWDHLHCALLRSTFFSRGS